MSSTVAGGAPWQENLAEMEVLTEDSLFQEISRQYQAGRMYSYVGEILCALNPFSLLGTKDDNICSPHVMERYTAIPDRDSFPPHIWASADMAYQAMLMHAKNQVCAVSGESGAGKTECAKLFTKQIVNCSQVMSAVLVCTQRKRDANDPTTTTAPNHASFGVAWRDDASALEPALTFGRRTTLLGGFLCFVGLRVRGSRGQAPRSQPHS